MNALERLRGFRWTLRRRLAATALALGALALAGHPAPGHVARLDTQELATLVSRDLDQVEPGELADWVIRGAAEYRLLDLRTEADYARYHIPGAESVPIAILPDYGLLRNEKVVLYAEGGTRAAQAWLLLRARDYRAVYILRGGLEAWQDEVLFPRAPAAPDPHVAAAFERASHVARFFGGGPRAAAASVTDSGVVATGTQAAPLAPALSLPKVLPAPARSGAPPARKKKEGC